MSDMQKVVSAVLNNNLLKIVPGRRHNMYQTMRLNPLWNWNREDTIDWIEKKKKDFMKFQAISATEAEEELEEEETDDDSDQ